ncbi:MAG TPA: SRPBCC domain-containing protein [Candidatus Dormibacteraeota bacterium]|nr:SRPBCC domain-containing protein [Candidatus Dormibacteraeota bacterium]
MASAITLATTVNAAPERIFEALSTSAGLSSFWTGDSRAEPKLGSIAVFGFGPTRLEMRVDALESGRRVAWTCMNDFPMEPHCWPGTTVAWELTEQQGGQTAVLLEHGGWPDSLEQRGVASTAFTWARILQALKDYLESGVPRPVFPQHVAL